MGEVKHTPGPWEVGHDHEVWSKPSYASVCMVLGNEEAEANARLIAAAPDLMEALYRLKREAEIAGLSDKAGWDCWISMANEALAKAESTNA